MSYLVRLQEANSFRKYWCTREAHLWWWCSLVSTCVDCLLGLYPKIWSTLNRLRVGAVQINHSSSSSSSSSCGCFVWGCSRSPTSITPCISFIPPPWKTLITRSSTDWSWWDQPAVSVCCSLFLDGSLNVRFVLTLVWQLLLDVKNHNVLHYYFLLHRTHQLHVWGATFVIIIMICRCCHKSDLSVLCCGFSLRLWRFIQTS